MSFYNDKNESLERFLRIDLNIDIENDFPFNGIDFEEDSLLNFYKNYLSKRKNYLDEIIERIEAYDYPNIEVMPFKIRKLKIKALENYKAKQFSNPIMLHRGLFDNKPTKYSNNKNEERVFPEWFNASMDRNQAQEFYNYTKHYSITDEKSITLNPKKGLKEQFKTISTDSFKKKRSEILNNEIALKKTMRSDYYVLQMIKYVFKKSNDVKEDFFSNISLKDFYLTKAEKQFYNERAEQQKDKQKGDYSEDIFNESYILKKHIPIKLLDGKIIDNVALKDSGKYKKLSQDQKVVQLTKYFDKVWTVKEIINELDNYEIVRSKKIFKLVHQLEDIVYAKAQKTNALELLKRDGKPNFNKYLTYYYLNSNERIDFQNIKYF